MAFHLWKLRPTRLWTFKDLRVFFEFTSGGCGGIRNGVGKGKDLMEWVEKQKTTSSIGEYAEYPHRQPGNIRIRGAGRREDNGGVCGGG